MVVGGENYPQLEQIVYRKLRKKLKKDLKGYSKLELFTAIHESIFYHHKEEVNAYFKLKTREDFQGCSACGKCCRVCDIVMTTDDINRLSRVINPTIHIKEDPNRKDRYNFKQKPCTFQDKDNRCTIYNYRPQSCRNYPLISPEGTPRLSRDPNCMFIQRYFIEKSLSMLKQVRGGL